ncbi:MAG TPA: GNAT family N-acetyltransferase [Chitinophagaceae bacterium]
MIFFSCKKFGALTPSELYEILHLRNEVFVVEQNCVFQDADHKDQKAHHLMAWSGDELAGYTRLLPPGAAYSEMSIGRVVTSPEYRRSGVGRKLMQESIDQCYRLFGKGPIRIGAQEYLKHFYESFGFRQVGEGYLEDGIPHIYMVREA